MSHAGREEIQDHPEPLEVEAVREALGALNKALRFRRMYPSTHEFYQKAIAELRARVEASIGEREEVRLDVASQRFTYCGQTVFSDERGQQNLPFRFYKDGIQSVTFHHGVRDEELSRFLDAIQTDLDSRGASADDLAIHLWNAGLEKITFYAVDELDPESARGERDEEEPEEAERPGVRELGVRVEELVSRLGSGALPAGAQEVAQAHGFLRRLSVGSRELLELERGEGFESIDERESEAEEDAELGAESIALQLAEMRDDSDLPRRTLGLFRWLMERGELDSTRVAGGRVATDQLVWDLLGKYLAEGRLDVVNRSLAELRFAEMRAQGAARAFCREILAGVSAPERIEAVLRLVNSRKADLKELAELLSVMPEAGLEALAPLFPKIRDDAGRKVVLDALVERAGASPRVLEPLVRGDDAVAALDAIKALRAVESSWALDIILEGLDSPHAEVRAEAIRAIPDAELERRDEALAERLDDPSPSVRGLAARRLALAGTASAIGAIRGRLSRLPTTVVEERVSLLRALAIADQDALELLLAEAGPRPRRFGLLPPGELDAMRHDLVLALRSVPTYAAREYLQRCAASDDRALRKLAEETLRGGGERSVFDSTKRVAHRGDGA